MAEGWVLSQEQVPSTAEKRGQQQRGVLDSHLGKMCFLELGDYNCPDSHRGDPAEELGTRVLHPSGLHVLTCKSKAQ